MSTFALVVVVFGFLIAISRAPLVVAPGPARQWILSLFENDGRTRAMGLVMASLGVFLIWGTGGVAGALAISFAIGLIGMMVFPRSVRPLVTRIFGSFSEPTLRVLGTIAVVIGLMLMIYGFNL
jgi:uncharacterized protein YjeT (DUF2065 family)